MKYLRLLRAQPSALFLVALGLILGVLLVSPLREYVFAQSTNDVLINPLGGNVGIGTATPGAQLGIAGAINFQLSPGKQTMFFTNTTASGIPTNDGFRMRLQNDFPVGGGLTLDSIIFETTDGNNPDPDNAIAFVNTGNDGIESIDMVLRGNGNVGIGTAKPAGKLHVEDNGDTGIYLTSTHPLAAETRLISVVSGGIPAPQSQLQFKNQLRFVAPISGGAKMVIEEDGNVGIGTATPAAKLDVAGTIKSSTVGTILYSGTNPSGAPVEDRFRIRLEDNVLNGGDALILEKTDGNNPDPDGGIAFVNTGNDGIESIDMVLRGNGNVGIGTGNPAGKLHLEDKGDTGVHLTSTHPLAAETRLISVVSGGIPAPQSQLQFKNQLRFVAPIFGDTKMVIEEDGNVGIGTATPAAKLDVVGNIKSSGTICDGSGNCLDDGGSSNNSLDAADGTPANAVYVNNVGDVGIGTTSPSQPLDVNGRTRTNDLTIAAQRNCGKLYTDSAGNVLCGDDVDTNSGGDITGVTVGTGLTGGGGSGEVEVEVDEAYVQNLAYGPKPCPTGFVAVNDRYCIDSQRPRSTLWDAIQGCADDNARLCLFSEWYSACELHSTGVVDLDFQNFLSEWIESGSAGIAVRYLSAGCTLASGFAISPNDRSVYSRCCYDR